MTFKTALRPLVVIQAEVREPELADEPVRIAPQYEVSLYEVLGVEGRREYPNRSWPVRYWRWTVRPHVSSQMRCGVCGCP